METFKLIIAGSRKFTDYSMVLWYLDKLLINKIKQGVHIEIISGGANGGDAQGERFSMDFLHRKATIIKADWEKYHQTGKSNPAGFIRNQEMADISDGLAAFTLGTPGTNDMISKANKAHMSVRVINVNEFKLPKHVCGWESVYRKPCPHYVSNAGELCILHKYLKCISCGAPATHGCSHQSPICGSPLCEQCSHQSIDSIQQHKRR